MAQYRIEKDSMGELRVPETAAWGAQTQRAVDNFPISGITMPQAFIQALGLVKQACANANHELGYLDDKRRQAISSICDDIIEGRLTDQFPVDVFQTGSATSSNMNANEVIAGLASQQAGEVVHPNDHVNMSQSSNDVIPTAIHVSAVIACQRRLLPSLEHLITGIEHKAESVGSVVTTGRTHLMDAMPISLGQILGGWAAQLRAAHRAVEGSLQAMQGLAIGGTAVGTGINAHERFGELVAAQLHDATGVEFSVADNRFAALSSQDASITFPDE